MDGVATINASDGELLARVRSGDGSSVGELVERHGDFVYAAALRVVGDAGMAGDVMQGVFLLLMRRPPGNERLLGWLHEAARNLGRNALRAQRRRWKYERAAAMEKREETASEMGIRAMVDEAIARLSAADREVVLRHYLEERTARELADAMQVSEAAMHKRIMRAMERLREKMGVGVTAPALVAVLVAERGVVAPTAVKAAVIGGAGSGVGSVAVQDLVRRSVMLAAMKKVAAVMVLGLVTGGVVTTAAVSGAGRKGEGAGLQPRGGGAVMVAPTAPVAADVLQEEQMKLKQLAVATWLYARKHDDRLPGTLGELYLFLLTQKEGGSPDASMDKTAAQRFARLFVSDRQWKGKALPESPTEKWINENAAWAYVAGGVRISDLEDSSATVMLHERMNQGMETQRGGKLIKVFPAAFVDGHVEAEGRDVVEAQLAATKKAVEAAREK